tara:strand:- start:7212 stop:7589 length:378 start_codon:yes stop_codon:yes gene_type:complete
MVVPVWRVDRVGGAAMSVKACNWAVTQSLPPAEFAVLMLLAHRANKDYQCWPSAGHIARAIKVKKPYVYKLLKRLEADELIKIDNRDRPNGSQQSNLYTINVPPEPETQPDTADDYDDDSPGWGD